MPCSCVGRVKAALEILTIIYHYAVVGTDAFFQKKSLALVNENVAIISYLLILLASSTRVSTSV